MSTLTFPRLLRYSQNDKNREPVAVRICREHCMAVPPKRILFLDDNTTLRDMLCDTILKDYACEFVPVGTVREAHTELEKGGIDAALLDIRLGDGNGIDLYREAVTRWPALEVVFLTALDDTAHRHAIESIGPARVFAKDRLSDFDFVGRLLAQLHVGKKSVPA